MLQIAAEEQQYIVLKNISIDIILLRLCALLDCNWEQYKQ